jgi:hypothetical protein
MLHERYGPGPATHGRGSTNMINGVYATYGIHMSSGKYININKSPSDHRWIEVNIYEDTLIGVTQNDVCPQILCKATSQVPSVKKHFQESLDSQVTKYKLKEWKLLQASNTQFHHGELSILLGEQVDFKK